MSRICYSSYHVDVYATKQPTREKNKELQKEFRQVARKIDRAVLAAAQEVLDHRIRQGKLHASFRAELSP